MSRSWFVLLVAALISVSVAPAAAAFEGRLVDARTGAPVAGAEVTIVGLAGSARSDADGRFTWRPDPRPPFTVLIVLADGRVAKPIYVETADWSAVLTLRVEAAETLAEAFRFLVRMRLDAQLAARRAGRPVGNRVELASLSALERRHLKDAFLCVRELQDELALDFEVAKPA